MTNFFNYQSNWISCFRMTKIVNGKHEYLYSIFFGRFIHLKYNVPLDFYEAIVH